MIADDALAVLLFLALLTLAILVKVAGDLASEDARGWLAKASKRLVRQAVARLPQAERQRYDEEWRGELPQLLDRPLTILLSAPRAVRSGSGTGRLGCIAQ